MHIPLANRNYMQYTVTVENAVQYSKVRSLYISFYDSASLFYVIILQ